MDELARVLDGGRCLNESPYEKVGKSTSGNTLTNRPPLPQ